jgi:NADPH-dependent curcumin reductase
MPTTNRQWIYSKAVTGKLSIDNFSYREEPVPEPKESEALVRVKLISLDPADRVYLVAPTYRAQVMVGDVMTSFSLGEVIKSNDERWKVGDLLHGDFGWQDYAIIGRKDKMPWYYKCTPGYSEEDLLGVLGITGMTSYFGMRACGPLKKAEVVVVGGASGACGSIDGQLAKIAGCRVIGFAGGPKKCKWVIDELGLDAAIDYKGGNIAAELNRLCPTGIDVFSDGVGGEVANATYPLLNQNGRVFSYGNISSYDAPREAGTPANAGRLGTVAAHQKIVQERNIKVTGFVVFEFYDERLQAEAELAELIKVGKLKGPKTVIEGHERLPRALVDGTFGGEKIGKLSVRIA